MPQLWAYSDWLDATQRLPRTPGPSFILMQTQTPRGPLIDGWVNGKFIDPERTIQVTVAQHNVSLKANADGMTGTIDGHPVNCRNLILDVETGELKLDDTGLLERIGEDFEFEI